MLWLKARNHNLPGPYYWGLLVTKSLPDSVHNCLEEGVGDETLPSCKFQTLIGLIHWLPAVWNLQAKWLLGAVTKPADGNSPALWEKEDLEISLLILLQIPWKHFCTSASCYRDRVVNTCKYSACVQCSSSPTWLFFLAKSGSLQPHQ